MGRRREDENEPTSTQTITPRASHTNVAKSSGEKNDKPNLTATATATRPAPPRPRNINSDLGDPGAIPIAVAGLHDKSKLVRWRAARVVGELGSREQEAVSLDEAREGEMEFEVAFEMSDAARKIRARVSTGGDEGEGEAGVAAGVGPVWRQIQERGGSK